MSANTKQQVLKLIEKLPEDVSYEDIMYELYFRQRVDRGLKEMKDGQTVSHADVKRSLIQWLQSNGH